MKKTGTINSPVQVVHHQQMREHTPVSQQWHVLTTACILLFLSSVTFLAYYPSLRYGFYFDDIANIVKHFNIRHYTFWDLFFSGSRWISYWLNSLHYKIGKFDPFSYRLGNVIIHTCNGLLIFFIFLIGCTRRTTEEFYHRHAYLIATLTALLFLLHPVQTQTVSYVIQGQLEGLAALFILSMTLTFMLYATARTCISRSLALMLLLALAPFACCTKEIAIIAPFFIIVADWFFIAQGSWAAWRQRWWLHLILTGITITVYLYLLKPAFFADIITLRRIANNNSGNVITSAAHEPILPGQFFISQFKAILHYLWIFIWPFNISVEYDWVLSTSLSSFDCWGPLLFLAACSTWIFIRLQRSSHDLLAGGLIWFFLAIIPRSSIIPSPELLFDYKTYFASAGWLFLLALTSAHGIVKLGTYLATSLHQQKNISLAYTCLVVIMAIPLWHATVARNHVWESGLAFWQDVISHAPGKARAYNNYGVELAQTHHKFKEAIPYFMKAIHMDKHYSDPYNNLAVSYAQTNDMKRAIHALRQGLAINPHYPEGYNNLASFLIKEKEYDQAEQALRTALMLRKHYGKAYFNLGKIALERNNLEQASEYFRKACMEADFDNEQGFHTYGNVCMMLKHYEKAVHAYTKALEFEPNNIQALFNKGNAHFLCKELSQAQKAYERLVTLGFNDERLWYNLGETYLAQRMPDKAYPCFEKITHHASAFPYYHQRVQLCHTLMHKNKSLLRPQ